MNGAKTAVAALAQLLLLCANTMAQGGLGLLDALREGDPLHHQSVKRHDDHALAKMPLVTDIDVQDESGLGVAPLCLAVSDDSADAFDMVFERVPADVADPNLPDRAGMFPLHFAPTAGNLAVVRFLVDSGADVNTTLEHGERSVTPLYLPYGNKRNRVSKFLKSRGADDLDRDARDNLELQGAAAEAARQA